MELKLLTYKGDKCAYRDIAEVCELQAQLTLRQIVEWGEAQYRRYSNTLGFEGVLISLTDWQELRQAAGMERQKGKK